MGLAHALKARLGRPRPWRTPDEDQSWAEVRFCVVDIETTGLSSARDEIISIGVAEIIEARITSHRFYEVVKPLRPISEESMRIHALTPHDLVDAPPISEVLLRLKSFLEGATIVAHAAWVERAFLDRSLKPLGERVPDDLVDTAALARALDVVRREPGREPSLEALSIALGLPVHTPHHALGDALTTAQILLALATRLEQRRGSLSLGELVRLTREHGT